MKSPKPRLFSGMQPTGRIHIGNYFGALKQFVDLQDKYDTFIFVANLHALTGLPPTEKLKDDTYNLVLDYLGAGLDPEKVTIFKQSDVPAHASLAWIFNNFVTMPYLMLAHAFKDKVDKQAIMDMEEEGEIDEKGRLSSKFKANKGHTTYSEVVTKLFSKINVGTFDYPVLMASDILLYDTDVVPVGKDQRQHVEYARDIAEKFNHQYGVQFKLPKELILEDTEIVRGVDGRKMSKSYNNTIPLFGSDEEITKAVMSVLTDSRKPNEIREPDELDTLVLYQLHKLFNKSTDLDQRYLEGIGYGDAKKMLINDIIAFVTPMRERRAYFEKNPKLVHEILVNGALHANDIAMKKIFDVYEAIGLTQ